MRVRENMVHDNDSQGNVLLDRPDVRARAQDASLLRPS